MSLTQYIWIASCNVLNCSRPVGVRLVRFSGLLRHYQHGCDRLAKLGDTHICHHCLRPAALFCKKLCGLTNPFQSAARKTSNISAGSIMWPPQPKRRHQYLRSKGHLAGDQALSPAELRMASLLYTQVAPDPARTQALLNSIGCLQIQCRFHSLCCHCPKEASRKMTETLTSAMLSSTDLVRHSCFAGA